MKKFIVMLCVLISGLVNGQELTNYYLEPGSNNQEVILHTSFYYYHGAGLIDSNVEVIGNTINFSICYQLSSTTVVTYDDQEFVINIPNSFPDYILNVNLYLWDQSLGACDYGNAIDGGPVNFDYPYNPTDLVQVPDDNFEGFFEAMNLGDGLINNMVFKHRIVNLNGLNINYDNLMNMGLDQIEDLTGIEHLPRIKYLFCHHNLITEYDATNNTALEDVRFVGNLSLTSINLASCLNLSFLWVQNHQLSVIDVSNNLNLSMLWINGLNLTEINLLQNINLTELHLSGTAISALDISQNTDLKELRVQDTPILALDLSNNQNLEVLSLKRTEISNLVLNHPLLESIFIDENTLTSIDVSMCPALESYSHINSAITSLDLSQNPELIDLFLGAEELVSLDLRNGQNENITQMLVLNLQGSLSCISVDNENQAPYPGWQIINGPITYSNDCALGINDSEINTMQLYPNPVSYVLNVQSQEAIKSLQLYDISGKLIFSSEENINQIDFSNYSNGLYFLKISTASGSVVEKILKM